MWVDVIDLRDFYASRLGRLARLVLRGQIRKLWGDVSGQRVLGVGFATPYLGQFQAEAERVIATMPPALGVMHWPMGAPSAIALAEDFSFPFMDRSMDRIVLVHALESSAHFRELLRECWRVLADGGSLIVIVPNRRGLWARIERTPFAQGRPYSMGQLDHLLRDVLFAPVVKTTALFFPPMRWPLFTSWSLAAERVGQRFLPTIAGINIIEAKKKIYAAPPAIAATRRLKDYVFIPNHVAPARSINIVNGVSTHGLRQTKPAR
ncbi:MAG: class I SAM-dependent methyltransferase [Rhodospirillaceae bacterium]